METLLNRASQRSQAAHNLMVPLRHPNQTLTPAAGGHSGTAEPDRRSPHLSDPEPQRDPEIDAKEAQAQAPQTPQPQLVERVTMSIPTDTSGWSEGRDRVNPRRVSSIGPEEEQEMREAMHWRALAAEHIGLSPQRIGMPVLQAEKPPPTPPPPPPQPAKAMNSSEALEAESADNADNESHERALSKAQTMLQLEVRRCQQIRAESERTAATLRKDMQANRANHELETQSLRDAMERHRAANSDLQEECDNMRQKLYEAIDSKRELEDSQQDCTPRQTEVLSELEEMLVAERAEKATLKAEMIVMQSNHASDLQAAYRRFQEQQTASETQRQQQAVNSNRSSASPLVIVELKQQLAESQRKRAEAETQAREAVKQSGSYAATQALRYEQQLQLAVQEAQVDAASKVVEEVERHSARVLAGLAAPAAADSTHSYGLSPTSSVKEMLKGGDGDQEKLTALSSAVVCLAKERDEMSARSRESMAVLESRLSSSRSQREKQLFGELAEVKAAVEDAKEQARIDRDMRGFYSVQLEQARKDAATSEMSRSEQVTQLREEIAKLRKQVAESVAGSPWQLFQFATQQFDKPSNIE